MPSFEINGFDDLDKLAGHFEDLKKQAQAALQKAADEINNNPQDEFDLARLMKERVYRDGEKGDGTQTGVYSNKQTYYPLSLMLNASAKSAATSKEKARRKKTKGSRIGKKGIRTIKATYKQVKRLNNLEDGHVTGFHTGKLWQNVRVQAKLKGTDLEIVTVVSGDNYSRIARGLQKKYGKHFFSNNEREKRDAIAAIFNKHILPLMNE